MPGALKVTTCPRIVPELVREAANHWLRAPPKLCPVRCGLAQTGVKVTQVRSSC